MPTTHGNIQNHRSVRATLQAMLDGNLGGTAAGAGTSPNKVDVGPSGHTVNAMWTGTQAEYDAISPKVATTLYVIV